MFRRSSCVGLQPSGNFLDEARPQEEYLLTLPLDGSFVSLRSSNQSPRKFLEKETKGPTEEKFLVEKLLTGTSML